MTDIDIIKKFLTYINQFEDNNALIRKKLHSLRVAELAEYLGGSDLYYIAGLVHDVGRFSQYSKYNTFKDENSIDHALEGYNILKSWNITNPYILESTKYHNKYKIPNITEKQFCEIIREADILDILNLTIKGELNILGEYTNIEGTLYKETLDVLYKHQLLPNSIRYKDGLNYFIGRIALIYNLKHHKSLEIIRKNNILDNLFIYKSDDPKINLFLYALYIDLLIYISENK